MSDPLLEAAIKRRFGAAARIENFEVATLGGSSRTLLFDLVDGAARRRLVSRQESYQAADSPFLSVADQFRAMKTAFDLGLPVPEPVLLYEPDDGMGQGFITAFVAGDTMPKRIQAEVEKNGQSESLVRNFATLLAKLHALPTQPFEFLAQRPDSVDALNAQRDRYDRYGQIRPAIEFGLRWLERRRPAKLGAPVLLHGDYRLGNFMIKDGAVAGLLDWECSHLGDPIEDIGWLFLRSWRFGKNNLEVAGLTHRKTFIDAYVTAGGAEPDPDSILWWQAFGFVRWAVLNLMQADGHVRGDRRGLVFAACGRNTALVEYDLMMLLTGRNS